jgi:bile acid:Na+ symporter, BASS family
MPFSQGINRFLLKLNNAMDRFIPVMTPLSVALGLFLPGVFLPLRPYVILLFSIMTFSGSLKLTAVELGAAVKSPAPILIFFFSSHVLMPLAALFSSSVFFNNPDVIAGFILLFAGPTAVSGFIWSAIFSGDKALGLSLILLDTLLAPLIVPLTLSILLGTKTAMDMSGIAVSLIFMVVVPTIIGVALNETSKGAIPQKICPCLDPLAKCCLMLVIAANSAAIAHVIRFNDPLVWGVALLCFILTVGGFLLARLNGIAVRCNYEKSAALIIAGGLKNNSAVMTIAVTFFPETAVLPTLMSIILQQTIAATIGKFLIRRIHNVKQIRQE